MNIVIHSENDLLEMAQTLLHYSVNLRHWSKEWERDHGVERKQQKKIWEEKMDAYLLKIGMEKTHKQNQINISIDGDTVGTKGELPG